MNLFLSEMIVNAILVGLIWTIQLINYPALSVIDGDSFKSIHQHHMKAITPLVGPLMILELLLCLVNTFYYSFLPVIFLSLVWATTYFSSVPIHNKLSASKEDKLVKRLIFTNWIRTFSWSIKLIIMLIIYNQQNK